MLIGLALMGFIRVGLAQEKGIKFEERNEWKTILKMAKEKKKFIFMDVFATWCVLCKAMDNKVFTSEKAGAFLNDRFICVRMQMDTSKNDDVYTKARYNDANLIRNTYSIAAYPTFLIFSPDGRLVHKEVGYKDVDELIEIASVCFDPINQYYTQLQKFRNHELSNTDLRKLAIKARSLGEVDIADEIANEYINNYLLRLNETSLFTKENLDFIGDFLGDSQSKSYKLFANHSLQINKVLGEHVAQNKIMDFIDRNYLPQDHDWKVDTPDWDSIETKIGQEFGILGLERVWGQRMIYYLTVNHDWNKFGHYYVKYFKRALRHSRYHVNNMTWPIFEHVLDVNILDFSINVMKYSLENYDQNNFQAYDTYANLLYKRGRKKEAIEWETKAVKRSGKDKGLVETLKKMHKNLPTWSSATNKF